MHFQLHFIWVMLNQFCNSLPKSLKKYKISIEPFKPRFKIIQDILFRNWNAHEITKLFPKKITFLSAIKVPY